MAYGSVECLKSLSRQSPSASVADGHGHNHWEISVRIQPCPDCRVICKVRAVKQFLQRIYGGLGIERIKACFYQQHVGASQNQSSDLLPVGIGHFIESHSPEGRIIHVR